jgi:Holliday junction resolvase RusA-like endonuclease
VSRVTFEVKGVAQVKGNARAFVPRKWAIAAHAAGRAPRAIVTLDHRRAKGWEQLVAEQAQAVPDFFAGAVLLDVTFHLPRPKTLRKGVQHHLKLPDLDKLVRCIGDALTGVMFDDDKQIVDIHARKVYAALGAAPSATITLEDAEPPVSVTPPLFALSESEARHGEEVDEAHHPRARSQTGHRRAAGDGGPRDRAARGGGERVRRDSR